MSNRERIAGIIELGGQRSMLLKIAVCDDEKPFRDYLKGIIGEILKERQIDFVIDSFSSGKEFVK